MNSRPEHFLSRWSRLKRQAPQALVPTAEAAPVEVLTLPDAESLVFADDFTGFLRQEVEEGIKRVALKKLFHSGQFVMDGLDIYIDDYSIPDPIDEATIRTLNQAKEMLFGAPAEPPAEAVSDASAAPPAVTETAVVEGEPRVV